MSKLEKIPINSLTKLRDKFLVEWPKYISSYYMIENYINWINRDAGLLERVSFWCLESCWETDGAYIITVSQFTKLERKIERDR